MRSFWIQEGDDHKESGASRRRNNRNNNTNNNSGNTNRSRLLSLFGNRYSRTTNNSNNTTNANSITTNNNVTTNANATPTTTASTTSVTTSATTSSTTSNRGNNGRSRQQSLLSMAKVTVNNNTASNTSIGSNGSNDSTVNTVNNNNVPSFARSTKSTRTQRQRNSFTHGMNHHLITHSHDYKSIQEQREHFKHLQTENLIRGPKHEEANKKVNEINQTIISLNKNNTNNTNNTTNNNIKSNTNTATALSTRRNSAPTVTKILLSKQLSNQSSSLNKYRNKFNIESVAEEINENKNEMKDEESDVNIKTVKHRDSFGVATIFSSILENNNNNTIKQQVETDDSEVRGGSEPLLGGTGEYIGKFEFGGSEITDPYEWDDCLEFSKNGLLICEIYSKYFGPCNVMNPFIDEILHEYEETRRMSFDTQSERLDGLSLARKLPVRFVRMNINDVEQKLHNELKMLAKDSKTLGLNEPIIHGNTIETAKLRGLEHNSEFSSPIPTYAFFKNGIRIAEMKGANGDKLTSLIKKHCYSTQQQNLYLYDKSLSQSTSNSNINLFLKSKSQSQIINEISSEPPIKQYKPIFTLRSKSMASTGSNNNNNRYNDEISDAPLDFEETLMKLKQDNLNLNNKNVLSVLKEPSVEISEELIKYNDGGFEKQNIRNLINRPQSSPVKRNKNYQFVVKRSVWR